MPTNDGLVLDDAYAKFLTALIQLNPAALHVKDNEETFASGYVVQNTAPAPHTLVFTSLLAFLIQHKASIDSIFLADLKGAMMSAKEEETSLAVVEKIEKPLRVFTMFRQHEKNTRTDFFSSSLFLNYLAHKIQLDTIFLQILPACQKGEETSLPIELLCDIIKLATGLRAYDFVKLSGLVREDYESRGVVVLNSPSTNLTKSD